MKWHLTKDELPKRNRLVIIYIPNRPWGWDGEGDIHYKIAWLIKLNKDYIFNELGPDLYEKEEVIAWSYFEEFNPKEVAK